MGPRMQRSFATVLRATPFAVAVCTLAACSSSMPDFAQFKLPDPGILLPSNAQTYVPPASARAFRSVAPTDLVDGQGLCAGVATAADEARGSEAATPSPPAVPRNIGLDMTECEVVRAIGQPQNVNVGANERGDRKVVMVYSGNEHAGTYEFVSGRLNSLERGPEAAPPPKPAKPAKKPPATATQQNRRQPPT